MFSPVFSSTRGALQVLGQYPTDEWLGAKGIRMESTPGEWPVAYHGTMESRSGPIVSTGFDITKGVRFK